MSCTQAKACGYQLAVSGPFGAIVFQVAATFRLRFGVSSNPEPHAQAKACGYQLAVNRYRQFFVDIDSLRAYASSGTSPGIAHSGTSGQCLFRRVGVLADRTGRRGRLPYV